MSRTSSRRLTALALIVFFGLSLPVSAAAASADRQPGVMERLLGWADSLWSLLAPESRERDALSRVVDFDAVSGQDRGALIDPNGGSGGQ